MSLRFDAKCSCAGCGAPVSSKVLENGGHRISTTTTEKGKREAVAEVATTCVLCGSRRVKVVTKVDVGAR